MPHRTRGPIRAALLALLPALVAACTSDDPAAPGDDSGAAEVVDEAFLAPDAPGPYTPSTLTDEITPDHGVPLQVQAWYPSTEPAGTLHRYDGFIAGAASDGLSASCDQARPVMVFSHGNGGMRWQSLWLAEGLAARGWVVVAPDHTFNTAFDMDDEKFASLVFRRPVDAVATFDWLVGSLAAPGGLLDGCVDPDAGYAMAGHSFGGYTTYAVAGAPIDRDASAAFCAANGGWLCAEVAAYFVAHPETLRVDLSDDRVWAAVPQTPAAYDALVGGLSEISVPVLTWGGGRDTLTPVPGVVRPLHEGLTIETAYLGVIEDAGHYSFSDACTLLGGFPDCEPPYRDPAEVHAVAFQTTVAFLDSLRGFDEAAAWLPVDDAGLTWEVGE
jgi:predicted dienelactone hydrolase